MLRQPISPNIRFSDYNNNNLHEYDTYLIDEKNEVNIDPSWWESLTYYIRELISIRLHNNFKLVTVKIPNEDSNKVGVEDPRLLIIYQSYIDGFDYNVWYPLTSSFNISGVKMIHIPDVLKKCFLTCNKDIISNDKNLITNFLKTVYDTVNRNQKYFVRLSSTSGKNEKAVKPFIFNDEESLDDVLSNKLIKHLTNMNIFATREYKRDKDTFLILIPWNDYIDDRCEFRIFVVNNKLTAASPQKWWEVHNYSPKELKAIETALNNCTFIVNDVYKTFVADVWIDMKNKTCSLIEFNPFGAHCGAGSSLFNWETDWDILHGMNSHGLSPTPVLRYLSIINY